MMGVAGTLSIPAWMAAIRRAGVRRIWFAAAAIGIAAAIGFATFADGSVGGARALLLVAQIVFTGFSLGFWAMLPDTVEYGELRRGVRVEAMAFGVSALVQKLALAAAAGSFGLIYARIGYVPGAQQSATTIAGIRWLMVAAPALGILVSAAVMAANPLKRGVHAAIVDRLDDRG
jgi:GPH family glycoside/pentoside/hexuronide:cation symporter